MLFIRVVNSFLQNALKKLTKGESGSFLVVRWNRTKLSLKLYLESLRKRWQLRFYLVSH